MRLLPAMQRMAGLFCRREDYLLERTNLLPSTSLKIVEVLACATDGTGGQQGKCNRNTAVFCAEPVART
jgi:hypothetical protein